MSTSHSPKLLLHLSAMLVFSFGAFAQGGGTIPLGENHGAPAIALGGCWEIDDDLSGNPNGWVYVTPPGEPGEWSYMAGATARIRQWIYLNAFYMVLDAEPKMWDMHIYDSGTAHYFIAYSYLKDEGDCGQAGWITSHPHVHYKEGTSSLVLEAQGDWEPSYAYEIDLEATVDESINEEMQIKIKDHRSLEGASLSQTVHGFTFSLPLGGPGSALLGDVDFPPRTDEFALRECVDYYTVVMDHSGIADMEQDSNFGHSHYATDAHHLYQYITVTVVDGGKCR